MPLRFWYLGSLRNSKYPFTPSSMEPYTRKLSRISVSVPGVYSSFVGQVHALSCPPCAALQSVVVVVLCSQSCTAPARFKDRLRDDGRMDADAVGRSVLFYIACNRFNKFLMCHLSPPNQTSISCKLKSPPDFEARRAKSSIAPFTEGASGIRESPPLTPHPFIHTSGIRLTGIHRLRCRSTLCHLPGLLSCPWCTGSR